ncbi:MAG: TIGR04255 family protein [Bacteroidetes bacterium]|nr:TIGR04255 family protein [Bacteroidota bacterium]
MAERKIPKKLTPDLLIETILEVKFTSSVHFEIFIGKMYNELTKQGYIYSSPTMDALETDDPRKQIIVNFNALQPIFENEKVIIKLTPNSIIFNCAKEYIGWDKYFPVIKNVLSMINKLDLIKVYHRIGLRYINSLQSINIYDKLIDEVRIKVADYKTRSTTFLTVIEDEVFNINLKVENDVKRKDQPDSVSLLDIDVYLFKEKGIEFDQIFDLVDKAHNKEKEVFVNLLKEEFITTLNPEY